MALKPTIYKAKINLADLNRNYFEILSLTIAQHPSETLERMMVRLAAFCLNASSALTFTKGLSTPDEPDIIERDLDDSIIQWIEVGEPTPEKIKKASRIARSVKIYSFNTKSGVWWEQNRARFGELKVEVCQFKADQLPLLVALIQRGMDLSVTVSEDTLYFSATNGSCDLQCLVLQA